MPPRDVERLLGWFADGTLVRASADAPNTVDLARAIGMRCGAPAIDASANSEQIADAIGPAEHIVFMLADGLGMNLIESLPKDSFLRRHVAMELQAVYPPSTAPALTSIATCEWPAQHAAVDWFVYFPARHITGVVLPFVERFSKQPLEQVGMSSEEVFPLASRLAGYEHDVRCHVPKQIAESVYSEYFSGGRGTDGYKTLGDARRQISVRIGGASTPTFDYLYVPDIDAAEHLHGPASREVKQAVRRFEQEMERLRRSVEDAARIVISADHGLIAVGPNAQCELADGDELLEMLTAPPAGEQRLLMLHVREGMCDRFAIAFDRRFGESWALLSLDEADALRLFGPKPLSPAAAERIGDFIAVPRDAEAVLYKPETAMIGFHGGMTRDEMLVPLIVA